MSDNENQIRLPEGLDVETATDVLREFAKTDNAQIINQEENADTLQSLRDELQEFKDVFAELLAEESPQSAETLSQQSAEALTEPYRDDEGDIEVDTLRQTPETGDVDSGGDDGSGSDGVEGEVKLDQIDRSTAETIETLETKRATFESRGMSTERFEEQIADVLGAESYEDIELVN